MMKHLLAIFLLVISGNLFGQTQEKTLLYQVKHKDYQTSYIFGTVHIIPDSLYFFPSKLEKALLKSDLLVLEIEDLSDRAKALELLSLKDGNCFDIFTAAEKDSVLQWGSAQMGIKPEQFEQLYQHQKPFTIMQLGMLKMLRGSFKMYEKVLEAKASTKKIPVKGLETMEFQIGIFDQLPDSVMAAMIMDNIRHPEKEAEANRELYTFYVQQDVEALASLTEETDQLTIDALLNNRNKNWIPLMKDFMKNQTCFFAVGAAHLGGERGILHLLQEAGFEIIPVKL